MAIAYLQEFEIKDGDTSTTNYDAVVASLNMQDAPDGLLIHTAGFDHFTPPNRETWYELHDSMTG
jgi:hypothetical protein